MYIVDGAAAPALAPCGRGSELRAIPRCIHQVFFPRRELPEEVRRSIAAMMALNPGWRHVLWDEPDLLAFVRESYGRDTAAEFDRIHPAYGVVKADLFRYLLIYACGGVYLDAKSFPARPLEDVIRPDDRYILSHWRNRPGEVHEGFGVHPELTAAPRGEFQQWHVIAAPGHAFLAAVIDRVLANLRRYNPALHGAGQHGVLRLSGPIAYTRAILPLLKREPHRRIADETAIGLTYSIFGVGLEHRVRVARHYSNSSEPILQVGPLTRLSAGLIRTAKALRRPLRSSGRSRSGPPR